jgi:hypothetical protein
LHPRPIRTEIEFFSVKMLRGRDPRLPLSESARKIPLSTTIREGNHGYVNCP